MTEPERFRIYRCPECGRVSDGWKAGPRYCAGNQWLMETPLEPNRGDHPSNEMERLTVEVVGERWPLSGAVRTLERIRDHADSAEAAAMLAQAELDRIKGDVMG